MDGSGYKYIAKKIIDFDKLNGYKYIAKKIIDFDKLNPIVISRFVKVFSRYNYYSDPYKSNMIETIKQIKKNKLSTNTKEVLDAIID